MEWAGVRDTHQHMSLCYLLFHKTFMEPREDMAPKVTWQVGGTAQSRGHMS